MTFVTAEPVHKGAVVFPLEGAEWIINEQGNFVCGTTTFNHRCDGHNNAIYVGPYIDAIIATEDIPAGATVYVNVNLVAYRVPRSFECECCNNTVEGFVGYDDATRQRLTLLTEPEVRRAAYSEGYLVKSASPLVDIRDNGVMGLAAFAVEPIAKGTVLFECGGLLVPRATMYTIQVGPAQHVLFGKGAECIAHCCDPNMQVVVRDDVTHGHAFNFVARRDVAAGEMLGFNYQSTEWSMQQGFDCVCGADCCAGTIAGFAHSSEADRKRMWEYSTDIMKDLVVTAQAA